MSLWALKSLEFLRVKILEEHLRAVLDSILLSLVFLTIGQNNFGNKIPFHVTLFDICSFSFQGAKTGKDNGYTMLFDIESFDYSYYDEGSEGLKVALVHHLDMPIMRQTGFHIAPGTENQVHYFLSKF